MEEKKPQNNQPATWQVLFFYSCENIHMLNMWSSNKSHFCDVVMSTQLTVKGFTNKIQQILAIAQ